MQTFTTTPQAPTAEMPMQHSFGDVPNAPAPAPIQAPAPQSFTAPVVLNQGLNLITENDLPCINDKAWDFCQKISKSGLLPNTLQSTPEHDRTADVYLMMITGKDLGLTFSQTIQSLFVLPNARPALYVQAKKAIIVSRGCRIIKEEYNEQEQQGICEILRDGITFRAVFTVQDAINRGKVYIDPNDGRIKGCLTAKGGATPWTTDWRRMCVVRAVGRCCDQAAPDFLLGLASAEDVQDAVIYDAPVQAPAPAPAKRTRAKKQDLEALIIPEEQKSEEKPVEIIPERVTVEPTATANNTDEIPF